MTVVTEEMLEELRALCVGDVEKYRAIAASRDYQVGSTDYDATWKVVSRLFRTAFVMTVHKRFDDSSDFEIMKFVAEKRAISERMADKIDPELAEGIILGVLGKGDPTDTDNNTRYKAQRTVLIWILADLKLRGEEMERFIAQARRITDKHFAKLAAEQEGAG